MKKTLFLTGLIALVFSSVQAQNINLSKDQVALKQAVFAGGCFWCMEPPFEALEGVLSVESGYAGGQVKNPTYKQVSSGDTGHYEVIRITYNPDQVTYSTLLEVFWQNVDALDGGGQFCDRGDQYRAAIFVNSEEEHLLAQSSKKTHESELGEKIVTNILPKAVFYMAENYHQDYYKRNPIRYKYYRYQCGRDKRLQALWSKPRTP